MPTSDLDGEDPVIVAGAGPVGMTAALALHARDVPVTILEADPADRDRPGSRAIYVHGSTIHILERNHPGLGMQLVEEGLVWPTRRTFFRGKEVFSRTYANPGGSGDIPHFSSLPQVRTEEFMLEALREAGIDIHWETPVETVETSRDGVVVRTGGSDGDSDRGGDGDGDSEGEVWETPYLVGADGAGSTVRKEIGAAFEGEESPNSFIIADVDERPDDPRERERVFHYDHPDLGGRNVLLVPFQGGWRVDIQCTEDDDPEALSEPEPMADLVRRALGERYAGRVRWVSDYKFLQVTADRFTDEHRRVLLAGEAGHLFAPFGARGMNSGVVDAEAAASAIAVARDARHDDVATAEIRRTAERRKEAAEWNRDAAGQALDHLRGDSLVTKAKQRLAAAVSGFYEPAGEWLDDAPYGPHGSPPVSVGRY